MLFFLELKITSIYLPLNDYTVYIKKYITVSVREIWLKKLKATKCSIKWNTKLDFMIDTDVFISFYTPSSTLTINVLPLGTGNDTFHDSFMKSCDTVLTKPSKLQLKSRKKRHSLKNKSLQTEIKHEQISSKIKINKVDWGANFGKKSLSKQKCHNLNFKIAALVYMCVGAVYVFLYFFVILKGTFHLQSPIPSEFVVHKTKYCYFTQRQQESYS